MGSLGDGMPPDSRWAGGAGRPAPPPLPQLLPGGCAAAATAAAPALLPPAPLLMLRRLAKRSERSPPPLQPCEAVLLNTPLRGEPPAAPAALPNPPPALAPATLPPPPKAGWAWLLVLVLGGASRSFLLNRRSWSLTPTGSGGVGAWEA